MTLHANRFCSLVPTVSRAATGRVRRRAVGLAAVAVTVAGCAGLPDPSLDAPAAGEPTAVGEITASSCTRFVATTGSDANAGTLGAPWRTLGASVSRLVAGDVLCVRGGTYHESVSKTLPHGTASQRITLTAYPGEHATIDGRTSFVDPDYWTISNLEWIWPASSTSPPDRIVSILGGDSWIFEGNDVHHGNYAGMLVGKSTSAGAPRNNVLRFNTIHDTTAVNLYYNPGRDAVGGLIEHNLFFNSGTENVKLGWGSPDSCTAANLAIYGIGEVTMRYNTVHNADRGAILIAQGGGQARVDVHHNLVTEQTRHLIRFDNNNGCLGTNVWVHDNAGGLAPRFAEDFGTAPQLMAQTTRNLYPIDPRYDALTRTGFHPTNAAAQPYGRYAGLTSTTTDAGTGSTSDAGASTSDAGASASDAGTSASDAGTGSASTPVFHGASSNAGGSVTSLALARPFGAAAGDVLVATLAYRGSGTLAAPAGWTLVRKTANGSSQLDSFVRVATASEPASYAFTAPSALGFCGGLSAFGGVSAVDASGGAVGTDATIELPAVSTTGANRMIVAAYGQIGAVSYVSPSGYTERFDVATPSGTYLASSAQSDRVQPTAGSTGSPVVSASGSGGGWMAHVIALK